MIHNSLLPKLTKAFFKMKTFKHSSDIDPKGFELRRVVTYFLLTNYMQYFITMSTDIVNALPQVLNRSFRTVFALYLTFIYIYIVLRVISTCNCFFFLLL